MLVVTGSVAVTSWNGAIIVATILCAMWTA